MQVLTFGRVALATLLFALVTPARAATVMADYLSFDGRNDIVAIPNSAILRPAQFITVEALIRARTIAANNNQDRVLSKGSEIELMISTGDTGCSFGTTGHVQWRANIGGTNARICGGTLSPNLWHHIAGTYNGSRFILYVDGVVVADVARTGTLASTTQPLTLGNKPVLDRPFDGDLDEVHVWNIARTAMQIQAARSSELTGTETGLVAYFRFNEGAGQIVSDATTNNNSGTLGTSSGDDSSDPFWVSSGATNNPPVVNAGQDAAIPISQTLALNGNASDDGLPAGTLTTWWSQVSGPGSVTFQDVSVLATTAAFSATGTYVLKLDADDGETTGSDTMRVTVTDTIGDPGVWPTNGWAITTPSAAGMNAALLSQARAYAKTAGGAGFITRGGKRVMSWGSTTTLFDAEIHNQVNRGIDPWIRA